MVTNLPPPRPLKIRLNNKVSTICSTLLLQLSLHDLQNFLNCIIEMCRTHVFLALLTSGKSLLKSAMQTCLFNISDVVPCYFHTESLFLNRLNLILL